MQQKFFEAKVMYFYDGDRTREISRQKLVAAIASALRWKHASDVLESLGSG
jgi:hypothetical protein